MVDRKMETQEGGVMTEPFSLEELALLVDQEPQQESEQEQTIAMTETPHLKLQLQEEQQRFSHYVTEGDTKPLKKENRLLLLDGWQQGREFLFDEGASGGMFFRFFGCGVAINPGKNFLERFHAAGFHVKEIDCVIVTKDRPEDRADLQAIYQLNLNYNQQAKEFHLLRYYLHPTIYQECSALLKPHFKQERNALFSLDLFVDSESFELYELSKEIKFEYMKDAKGDIQSRFTLRAKGKEVCMGSVSGTKVEAAVQTFFSSCDLLLFGLGTLATKAEEIAYEGLVRLIDNVQPKLSFVMELASCCGDARLRLVKALREATSGKHKIFPVEASMQLDLETIDFIVEGQTIPLEEVTVYQPGKPFSPLVYLDKRMLL